MFGPKGGMRRIPKAIYAILRHTIVPSATIEEVIYAMMFGDELNLLDLMVNQMLECKRDVRAPLALQPYIMALVLRTVEDFYRVCEV